MDWLYNIDEALFRVVHEQLRLSALDRCMPWLAANPLFVPALLVLAVALCWKDGRRGRVFVGVLALTLAIGEGWVIQTIKHLVDRPRPFAALEGIEPLVGKGRSGSMPSGHTSIWFAATSVAFVYYRNSWRWMLPMACLIGYSRIYLGVHFPSDVLAGALLGMGYALALLWGIERLWQSAGSRWFPQIFLRLPSLLDPKESPPSQTPPPLEDIVWRRLGYLWIGIILLTQLVFLASGSMELSEDEAYQWLWSKHLAASYFSKPPLIAYAQFVGTSLWGDTQFGVRFLSPVLAAIVSLVLLRFLAREVDSQAGFWLVVCATVVPLLAVGGTLLTVDPLLVAFWVACLVTGWKAVQPGGPTRHWLWSGFWAGLAFLSKYSGLFLIPCFLVFFALWPPARRHLLEKGPYLAFGVILLSTLPVLLWNFQNHWITLEHLASNAKLNRVWQPTPRYFLDFTGSEAALLNPFFFVAALLAMIGTLRRRPRRPLELFLFSLGAPVFLGYWAYTIHSRVLANWIAPAVLPMLVLMVIYWQDQWRHKACQDRNVFRACLTLGLAFGGVVVLLLHEPGLIKKIAGRSLPAKINPIRRVSGWTETAKTVSGALEDLGKEGPEAFVIGNHYGITGILSFYMPEARPGLPGHPLVYFLSHDHPKNQFYFWPEYRYRENRRGQNAIFVKETDHTELPPVNLVEQFESIQDLGLHAIQRKGVQLRQIQLFACRALR